MTTRFQTSNLPHLKHLHPVLIANGQIILLKKFVVVPMSILDPNDSNRIIQQTIERMDKNKET